MIGAAWLATVALALAIPAYAGAHSGTAVITLHLTLTGWMAYYWWRAREGQVSVRELVLLGLIARVLLIAVDPFTTHDVERYLWDGAVAVAGLDPYVLSPDDPEVAGLRAQWPTPEEHAAYPTLYPPLALMSFAASAVAGPQLAPWLWKIFSALGSISVLLLGAQLLVREGRERHLPLLALSPLMLLEAGVGAHIDILATLAVVLALSAASVRRWAWVGVAIGCGTAIKLLPVLMLLPLAWALPGDQVRRVLAGAAATVATIYGATMALGLRPLGSLPVFFEKWRFGSPIFDVVQHLDVPVVLPVLALGLFASACWWARRDLHGGLALALAVPLLLSPVVFPWYLLPLIPLLALRPNAFGLVWVTLAPLTYEVLDAYNASGVWHPASWPLWVLAGGWLLGLILSVKPVSRTAYPLDSAGVLFTGGHESPGRPEAWRRGV